MSFLLDTNVISELRKREPNEGVATWAEQAREPLLHTSVLVLAELRRGIELSRKSDAATATRLERWLSEVAGAFGSRALPVTAEVANRWALLGLQQPLPVVDGLLSATALVHGLTIVTRNTKDFSRAGVPVLNPFS